MRVKLSLSLSFSPSSESNLTKVILGNIKAAENRSRKSAFDGSCRNYIIIRSERSRFGSRVGSAKGTQN